MNAYQAKRIRTLIDSMARQLESETDPAKRFELKRAIRAGEIKLTTG
jgi:hypothetical protein